MVQMDHSLMYQPDVYVGHHYNHQGVGENYRGVKDSESQLFAPKRCERCSLCTVMI